MIVVVSSPKLRAQDLEDTIEDELGHASKDESIEEDTLEGEVEDEATAPKPAQKHQVKTAKKSQPPAAKPTPAPQEETEQLGGVDDDVAGLENEIESEPAKQP